jgi:hypothetical protein
MTRWLIIRCRPELVGLEGLGQVVVGAGGKTLQHRLGAAPRRQQDDVDDALAERLARELAELEPVDHRHVQIDDRDADGEIFEQRLPRQGPVGGRDDLVPPLFE